MTTRFADCIGGAIIALVIVGPFAWLAAELFGRHPWIDTVANVCFAIVFVLAWAALHLMRPVLGLGLGLGLAHPWPRRPAEAMDEQLEAEVRRLIEPFLEAFAAIDPEFPTCCCVSSCLALQPFLALQLDCWADAEGRAEAVEVERWAGWWMGNVHQWLVIDGAIVDPTAGQFIEDSPALHIYREDDTGWLAYEPMECQASTGAAA